MKHYALPALVALLAVSASSQVRLIRGNQKLFGTSLGIADIDGDGKVEYLVGAPASPGVAGRVQIHNNDLTQRLAFSGPGGFGLSAAFLGDTDRDGHRDFIVGALDQVFIISGKTASLLAVFKGPKGTRYGTVVADAGDVDKDGFGDILIGAPAFNTALGEVGAVEVRSGRTGGVLHRFFGTTKGARMGRALTNAGDIDRDGHDDILVGSPGARTVHCFSGKTGKIIHTITRPKLDHFGFAIDGGTDLDGDNTPDFAVGAPDLPISNAVPSVTTFSGKTGAALLVLTGLRTSWFGYALTIDADTSGDKKPDIVVGMPGIGTFSGGFATYSADGTLLSRTLLRLPGSMGSSFAAGGGVLAVGVPTFEKGYAQLFTGRITGVDHLTYYPGPVATSIGKACGSKTPATLHVRRGRGTEVVFDVRNLKPPTAGLLVFGTSATRWRGMKLPVDLGPFGFTGCQMLVSQDIAVVFRQYYKSTYTLRLNNPYSGTLLFYAQAWTLDANANPGGVATSNGVRISL